MFELTPFVSSGRRGARVYDPFREMEELERRFFGAPTTFSTDIADRGNAYVVTADLPGFEREDIKIDLTGDTLTVSAERKDEREEKGSGDKYLRRERYYGSYSRAFDVSGIDTDAIDATYKNGVLTLELPKKKEEKPSQRTIEIK